MTTELNINVWRRRLTLIRAGSMSARGRAFAVLATTTGVLALSGVAPAGAAQARLTPLARAGSTTTEADLATTMTATGWGSYRFPASFTTTITNNGPDPAQNVVVSDSFIPATFTNVVWTFGVGSCTTPPLGGVGTITCTTGSLAPGGVAHLTVNLVTRCWSLGQFLTNTASATSSTNDPNPSNNTASRSLRC